MTISGLRQEYSPVHPQERPTPSAREPHRTCPSRLGQYAVAALVLCVNYATPFDRCIDGYSAGTLVSTYSISPDQNPKLLNLSDRGYLVKTESGFEASEKLFQAIHQKDPDTELVNSLKAVGINPDPKGFTSEHCQYTLLELFVDVSTGNAIPYCPPYHFPKTVNTTCKPSEQDSGKNQAEIQNTSAKEFLANPGVN